MTKEQILDGLGVLFVPEPNTGCWLWLAATGKRGYGVVIYNDWMCQAHRVVYAVMREKIDEGLTLDHLCRTPNCVNPDHMEPVSRRENTLRGTLGIVRKAIHTHCKRGHELTPENTMLLRKGTARQCRTCSRVRMDVNCKAFRARKKAEKAAAVAT